MTPESSDFTSVKERIEDRQSAMKMVVEAQAPSSGLSATFSPGAGEKGRSEDALDQRIEHGEEAGWLAPIALEPPRKKVREKQTTRRASNKGCLSMTLDQYLKLLDWTGRQILKEKVGAIPGECAPILKRLERSAEAWVDFVRNFRKRFRNEAGLPRTRQNFRTSRRDSRSSFKAC